MPLVQGQSCSAASGRQRAPWQAPSYQLALWSPPTLITRRPGQSLLSSNKRSPAVTRQGRSHHQGQDEKLGEQQQVLQRRHLQTCGTLQQLHI